MSCLGLNICPPLLLNTFHVSEALYSSPFTAERASLIEAESINCQWYKLNLEGS